MMDPHSLIPPANPLGYPTPFWFIEVFKVLGFSLHVVGMNLWYAGAVVAAIFGVFGQGSARLVGRRVAHALPFALALGINFGIIPLLFIQVAYYQFLYPATILMAWPWFAVFWLVIAAYSSAYIYRVTIRGYGPIMFGWVFAGAAAGLLVLVGFLFANGLSLMTNVSGWWSIFRGANNAGAATGIALNTGDPTLIPRWLFMFGLAITTTAAYVMIDAAFMADRESEDYRRYAARFSGGLYTLGLLWFVGFGSWYIFGTRLDYFMQALDNPWMRVLFPLTAISPGLPWALIMLQWKGPSRMLAALAGIAQFGVIGINAVSRQWLQNMELAPYANLAAQPVRSQNSAIGVFLFLFLVGVGLSAWLVKKAVEANRAGGPAHE